MSSVARRSQAAQDLDGASLHGSYRAHSAKAGSGAHLHHLATSEEILDVRGPRVQQVAHE